MRRTSAATTESRGPCERRCGGRGEGRAAVAASESEGEGEAGRLPRRARARVREHARAREVRAGAIGEDGKFVVGSWEAMAILPFNILNQQEGLFCGDDGKR